MQEIDDNENGREKNGEQVIARDVRKLVTFVHSSTSIVAHLSHIFRACTLFYSLCSFHILKWHSTRRPILVFTCSMCAVQLDWNNITI